MDQNFNKDILTEINKEKFRRLLLLSSRLIALLLVGAIIWIGFIQITYMKEVNRIKAEYGNLGYCYMCGLESLRKCECQYRPDIDRLTTGINYTQIAYDTALYNTNPCPNKNQKINEINFTF